MTTTKGINAKWLTNYGGDVCDGSSRLWSVPGVVGVGARRIGDWRDAQTAWRPTATFRRSEIHTYQHEIAMLEHDGVEIDFI